MSNKNQLRVAHLTTAGQKCGIGEYTLRFIENLPDNQVKHFIVTCQTPEKVFNLELMKEEFVIGWYFDNIKYHDSYIYPDSFEKICNWNADIVLIQYHHGFFSSDDLFYFSKKILTAGMKLFFVIHNYAKADIDLIKKLQSLNATFLSHSQREINTALTHGIKLLYIPMGIDVYEQIPVNRSIYDRNWEVTPPIIVNTGFLRMHKGLQSLIRAIALMQDRFPGTKLLLQCALYSSEDSHRTLAECKELIRKLELQWLVHIDDVFLPKSMIYENISKADIAVLPYTESDEGGSASAASCFAVGLPVVVSNAEIFSDIEEYTMKLPEATPEIIADFLVGLLDQPALYSEQVTKTNNYLHEASWGRVTKTLLSLILNPE